MDKSPSPVLTKLLTVATRLGLKKQVEGAVALLCGTDEWVESAKKITKKRRQDLIRIGAKMTALAGQGVEKSAKQDFCSYPMKGTEGLFELRVNGLRFYGGRLTTEAEMELLVLLGAENKAGKSEADKALLEKCTQELTRLRNELASKQQEQKK